jgi:hypothetical protein
MLGPSQVQSSNLTLWHPVFKKFIPLGSTLKINIFYDTVLFWVSYNLYQINFNFSPLCCFQRLIFVIETAPGLCDVYQLMLVLKWLDHKWHKNWQNFCNEFWFRYYPLFGPMVFHAREGIPLSWITRLNRVTVTPSQNEIFPFYPQNFLLIPHSTNLASYSVN